MAGASEVVDANGVEVRGGLRVVDAVVRLVGGGVFWKALGLSLPDSELGRFPKGLTGCLSFSPRGFLSQG